MPLTYQTHHDCAIETDCTSYQGDLLVPYHTLVATFGAPLPGDDYKVDAEWHFQFEDGAVATLYNWKNGPNYLGDDVRLDLIDEWNVGGHAPEVVERLARLLHLTPERHA